MIIIEREFKRSHLVQEEALSGMTFTGEDGGHKFIVHVKSPAGEAETLTGSVVGKFVRADGVTVELTAAEDYAGIENGAAWVILAANCYTQAGPFRLTVTNIASDETRNTVCAFTGYVRTSETDEIVDPENVINVDAIVGMIDEMEDATEAAQEAASFVNSIIAPSYSTSLMYAVGDYCTYNGAMYRCTTATDGAFNPNHWQAVKVGSEFQNVDGQIDDLKSAVEDMEAQIVQGEETYESTITPVLTANTAIDSTDGSYTTGMANAYASTDFIDIVNATKIVHSFWGYGNYGFAFYTSAKVYISGTKNVMTITDIPENAAYIRFTDYVAGGTHSAKTVTITFESAVVGGIKDIAEASVQAAVTPVSDKVDALEGEIITPDVLSDNLIDPSKNKSGGYYLHSSGAWVDNASFLSSGLIPCKKNDVFSIYTAEGAVGTQATYWKADGTTYVSGADVSSGNSITVPNNDNIAFLRVSMYVNGRTYYRLNKGTTPKDYDAYQYGYGFTSDVEAPNIRALEAKAALIGNKYAHFSFDDCVFWEDLTTNADNYDSCFENEFLGYLKYLHDLLGLKFSLFCFITYNGTSIADVTDKFAAEFAENKDWLRFGFHGTTASETFTGADPATVAGYYSTFVTGIYKMTGDYDCIDRVTRTSSFSGDKAVLKALRDCDCGLRGFLCTDGSGGSYYLSADQNSFINSACKWFEEETQLFFIHSISRLEGSSISVATLDTLAYQNHLPIFEFFTHQDQFSANVKDKMRKIGEWLNAHGFVHTFSQYVLNM